MRFFRLGLACFCLTVILLLSYMLLYVAHDFPPFVSFSFRQSDGLEQKLSCCVVF